MLLGQHTATLYHYKFLKRWLCKWAGKGIAHVHVGYASRILQQFRITSCDYLPLEGGYVQFRDDLRTTLESLKSQIAKHRWMGNVNGNTDM
jgi:hypothetical protein